MTKTITKKFDSFKDLLGFSHSIKFPGSKPATGELAKSGLYEDRSFAGISDCENDFHEMKEWLARNNIVSKTGYKNMDDLPEDQQRKIAAGYIKGWDSYKLSVVATRNYPWVHPYGVHASLAASLATDFTNETIEKIFENASLSKFCIKEAKLARDSGIGIHQAYGSWRKMVQAFLARESEIGLTETTRPQFVISALKLNEAYKRNELVSDKAWREVAETHIMAKVTPDHVYSLYEQIKNLQKGDEAAAKDLYDQIFSTPYRMDSSGRIVKAESITYEVDDQVFIKAAMMTGVITSVEENTLVVKADQEYEVSLENVSMDAKFDRSRSLAFGM